MGTRTTLLLAVGLGIGGSTAAGQEPPAFALVDVSERETSVGWVYEYRVTNTSTYEFREVVIGDTTDGPGTLREEAVTTISPPGWWSTIPFEDIIGHRVLWHATQYKASDSKIDPGWSQGELILVYRTKCLPCTRTGFEVITTRDVPLSGRVRQVEAQPGPLPLVVDLPTPPMREDEITTGTIVTTAAVSDPSRVDRFFFDVDLRPIVGTATAPFSITWDTRQAPYDGWATITAEAVDKDGRRSVSAGARIHLKYGHPYAACPL